MNDFTVLIAVAALVMLFVLAEIAAAALPLILVVALVPPEQRRELAEVLAAYDSSRRLRFWPALRAAVRVRRQQARDRHRNPRQHLGDPFRQQRRTGSVVNPPHHARTDVDRPPHMTGPGVRQDSGSSDER